MGKKFNGGEMLSKTFVTKKRVLCIVQLFKHGYDYSVVVDGIEYYRSNNLTFATQRFNEV